MAILFLNKPVTLKNTSDDDDDDDDNVYMYMV